MIKKTNTLISIRSRLLNEFINGLLLLIVPLDRTYIISKVIL